MKIFLRVITICTIIFILFGCSSKRINEKIETIFEKTHEKDVREAVTNFENYSGNYYIIKDDGFIVSDKLFLENIDRILNIHKEYHLSNIIPRDSSDWKNLMYYKRHPEKSNDTSKQLYITQCPFCIAEEKGDLKVDEIDENCWLKTDLFLWKIDERKEKLLSLMKDDEMAGIIAEYTKYLLTGECVSDKVLPNVESIISGNINSHKYYMYRTKLLNDFENRIDTFHETNHCIGWFKNAGKTLFYQNSNIEVNSSQFNQALGDAIPYCPVCLLIGQKIQNGEVTSENRSISCSHTDYYYWLDNGFAVNCFKICAAEQEEKRIIEEQKKKIAAMPLYSMTTIDEEIRSNKIAARKKFDGQQIKVKGKILCVDEDKIELWEGGPYIFLKESELEKLKADQYITFIAKIKFFDTSSNQSSSTSWFDEVDSAFSDLDTLSEDLKNGGVGYSFENCQIISQ